MDKKTIRLYKPGDEHGIISLFKEVFGREMSINEWQWKYKGRGNDKVYASVAISKDGKIVAHYGGIPHRMIYKGSEVKGLSIVDVMVHPTSRGPKTFKDIAEIVPAEAVSDGIILGYGFPNERAFRLPERLGIYEKIEDVMEATKELSSFNNSSRFIYKLFPLSINNLEINTLWNRLSSSFCLSLIRDIDYLSWRYANHPFFKYEIWGIRYRWSNKLIGWVILRQEEQRTLIVDFLCSKNHLKPLLLKIQNYSIRLGKKYLCLWCPPYLKDSLREIGFSVNISCTCIPRTTHEKTLKKDEMSNNFFYTMGDTDFL